MNFMEKVILPEPRSVKAHAHQFDHLYQMFHGPGGAKGLSKRKGTRPNMKHRIVLNAFIACLILLNLQANNSFAQVRSDWQAIARIKDQKTHVVPAFWQGLPKLDARTKIKILDVNGPGVVSVFHCCNFVAPGEGLLFNLEKYASENVILRVFYDNELKPSIDMPLMDFFADIQSKSSYFSTVYFSKVKESHNSRLPMPFRKRIAIEIENPTAVNLTAYTDIQWEKVAGIPDDCGYLRTDYRTGNIDPKRPISVFELHKAGSVAAHWLQFESGKSFGNGDLICEANQEVFLDNDPTPTLNYLGTEDAYGFSWGFRSVETDQFVAILKREELQPSGRRIAMLRCRDRDMISFKQSCNWVITYLNDVQTVKDFGASLIPYRHCVYYYSH
jgi:hypothetical protein